MELNIANLHQRAMMFCSEWFGPFLFSFFRCFQRFSILPVHPLNIILSCGISIFANCLTAKCKQCETVISLATNPRLVRSPLSSTPILSRVRTDYVDWHPHRRNRRHQQRQADLAPPSDGAASGPDRPRALHVQPGPPQIARAETALFASLGAIRMERSGRQAGRMPGPNPLREALESWTCQSVASDFLLDFKKISPPCFFPYPVHFLPQ